ncbi:MAG: TolC family protein [Spirochaetota bacterium]
MPTGPAGRGDETVLSLDLAIELALERSQSLRRETLSVDIARAELDQARAAFGPSVSGSIGTAWITNPPDGITIPAGEFGTVSDPTSTFPTRVPEQPVELVPDPENLGLSASVLLEQPLFTWGKLRAGERGAVAGVDASLARRDTQGRAVRRDVTKAYVGLLAARASVELVSEIVTVQEERVDDARRQFDAGASTRRAVLAESSALAAARSQLVRATQSARTAASAVRWYTGVAPERVLEPTLPSQLPDEPELVRRATEGHPRLAELRARREQAGVQRAVSEASAPFLPDFGLRVEAEVQGQRLPLIQSNWIDSWDANLTISIGASASLYDGGRNRASQASSQAQVEQALSAIAEYTDAIPLEVRATLERFVLARTSEQEALASLEEAREQLRIARVSRENELISQAEARAAEIPVLQARLLIIAARADAGAAVADLEYIVGPLR